MEIAKAVPAGSRRAWDPHAWLMAIVSDPDVAALRADFRHTVIEFARIQARHVDWATRTVWRPRALMCDEIGSPRDRTKPLSVSAWKAARRLLESLGYLGLVQGGWTPRLRAMALHRDDPDHGLSPLFVITVPRKRRPPEGSSVSPRGLSRPLTRNPLQRVKPLARARRKDRGKPRTARAPRGLSRVPHPAEPWPQLRPVENRSEEERAAGRVRELVPVLRQLTPGHVRFLIAKWLQAGWCVSDVVFAINHDATGQPHGFLDQVRYAPGWLSHRMSRWLSPAGDPLPSSSQRRTAEHERARAEQLARRQARQKAAEHAAEVDVAAHAARARKMLAARHRPVLP